MSIKADMIDIKGFQRPTNFFDGLHALWVQFANMTAEQYFIRQAKLPAVIG